MTKDELLAELDCREMDLRIMVNRLMDAVQLVPGDESARALRHVCDVVGTALSTIGYASVAVRDMGEW